LTEAMPRPPIPMPPNVMRSLGATAPARAPKTVAGTIIGAARAPPAERKPRRETESPALIFVILLT